MYDMNMLEHQKKVLKAVSDNYILFQKELKKSLKWLNEKEIIKLKNWLRDTFYHQHPVILSLNP